MLSTITDDEQAIRVEKELTELQVKIAGIKTRMTEIRTDVDYSTIELQLREVTKYDEAPQQTDTFFQRLGNTITDTWPSSGSQRNEKRKKKKKSINFRNRNKRKKGLSFSGSPFFL